MKPIPEDGGDEDEGQATEGYVEDEPGEEQIWVRGEEGEEIEEPDEQVIEEHKKRAVKWKEFLEDAAHVKVRGLTFAVPLQSRKSTPGDRGGLPGVQPHSGSPHTNPSRSYGPSEGILQQRLQEVGRP